MRAAAAGGAIVKVIFENAYLNDEEKAAACRASEAAGAAFVKTSTGFAAPASGVAVGSTPADLRLMRSHTGSGTEVKAAGGIRTHALLEAVACGATRIGTTSTVAIAEEASRRDPRGEGMPVAASVSSTAAAAAAGPSAARGLSLY